MARSAAGGLHLCLYRRRVLYCSCDGGEVAQAASRHPALPGRRHRPVVLNIDADAVKAPRLYVSDGQLAETSLFGKKVDKRARSSPYNWAKVHPRRTTFTIFLEY